MLYKKTFSVLVFISFVVSPAFFPSNTYAERGEIFLSDSLNTFMLSGFEASEDKEYSNQEQALSMPLKSGPVTYVPWDGNATFLNCQAINKTPVMMSAYRTVLHDPLPGEEDNVHLAARLLAGTVVKPGEVFSQNRKAGPYTRSKGYQKGPTYSGANLITTIGGGVCKIASTLYNVTIQCNLPVIERYAHSMPVPYVPYGQDATVSYGNKDFKFKNNTDSPILIWAQGVDNVLYIAFYGTITPPKVEWHHKMLKVIKAGKIYRINPALPAGSEKLLSEGMDGALVKSWVTIENPDETITTRQLGNSYYSPMPYVYEKGR